MAAMEIGEKALNEKIMGLVCAQERCKDTRSIMLERSTDSLLSYNWIIGHFDPGRGDRYACKLALRRIHEALRDQYVLVGPL